MSSTRLTRLAVILSSAAIISYSSAAHAGFEWKGPLEAPAQPAAAPEMSGMSDMAPIASDSAPAPAEAAAPASPAPVASAPVAAPVTAAAAPAATGDVVAGFAKDVPLVMALQQIVPPGYQYSFSSGVDAGTSVSWEGGKPWQSVLGDMLATHGLGYSIQNNTVVVGASQAGDSPAAAPAPAAAPVQDAMMTPMPGDASPAAQNSSAPLNIVSPPPAESGSAAPVAASPATQEAAAPAMADAKTADAKTADAKKEDTVTIHRDKPKSLLERLFGAKKKDDAAQTAAAKPAPEKVAAADVSMPAPAAAPATATDAAPATAQPAAAMTATMPAGSWQGAKGATLRDVLKTWSDKAGVDLYWSIDYDYRLSEDVGLTGSYDEAVGTLLDKFASVRPQPYGQLHQGGSGPRVLVIKSYDLAQ